MSSEWITDRNFLTTLFAIRGLKPGDEFVFHSADEELSTDWYGVEARVQTEQDGGITGIVLYAPKLDPSKGFAFSWTRPRLNAVYAWRRLKPE